MLLFPPPGHFCRSGVPHHREDSLHLRPGRLHTELQAGSFPQRQVCGVPDASGRQRVLQLHHAVPPALVEHVHWRRYQTVTKEGGFSTYLHCVLRSYISNAIKAHVAVPHETQPI